MVWNRTCSSRSQQSMRIMAPCEVLRWLCMCGPCRAVFGCNAVGRVVVHVRVGCGEECQGHVMQWCTWCVGAWVVFGCEQQAVWERMLMLLLVSKLSLLMSPSLSEASTAATALLLRCLRRCCCRRRRRHCVGVSLCAVCMWKCWCWGVCEGLQCSVHAQGVARARRKRGPRGRHQGRLPYRRSRGGDRHRSRPGERGRGRHRATRHSRSFHRRAFS